MQGLRLAISYLYSYLNPLEFTDLEVEKKYFESNPTAGRFYNKLITGTLLKPPQDDLGLIKVCVCAKLQEPASICFSSFIIMQIAIRTRHVSINDNPSLFAYFLCRTL